MSFLIANNADWRLVNASGATPLHHFASFGRHHGAAQLLASGADPNARSSHDGNTPLHNAALGQHVHTAQLLLGFGADPGVRNARGLTPFDLGLFGLAQPPTHMTT
ncbi:hypothetical protein SPRG_05253 [Saprolegnia parasitica CBS 223.65]|uniref:Uncharacterized protein n=1 Tax=Saprolegnia parasitica (strain CBS 223.65) TaxID=695850 RepID=A0A067CTE7_SAPPC|nr:hypothetical protein SPRG_05253 [Saprolegnia parasitica CBS 223.65]KDO30062.1 hypothetical protein SPRG_05253 [Saprolegnia parasitica CBS 223.65]|eukprot:XP_012199243.1 hypothetical protein SPRG_05253 [Saprolegnia parasitica CBS 223.65]